MSQRHSEYELLPGDCYYTPAWVTEALLDVEKFPVPVLEPAAGEGHMSEVITKKYGSCAIFDLLRHGVDFLTEKQPWEAIITNPPYSNGLAEKFVRKALDLTEPYAGKVAMLLPLAWDSAKGRRDLFKDHPAFKAKYTLTKRIRWVNLEQKKNGPSQNHAWFVWEWGHSGPPTLGYLP
jgi:hypothetical protein